MAELVLTEEEEEANSYLSWDDESLGKLVKKKALDLEDYYGDHVTTKEAAVVTLLADIAKQESEMAVMEVEGVVVEGNDLGHWRITFERVDPDLPGGPPLGPDDDGDDESDPDQDGGVLIP